MKKFISVLCLLSMMVGVIAGSAVSAGAVDSAQTVVDVKSGDEVTYALTLGGVPEPIIGCDFSFYYDSSLFEVVSVADFNDQTDEDEWLAVINPDLDGEVRGNWSILKGVDFSSDRHFLTLNLKAKQDGTGHLSYFIRYMYDNNIFNSDDKPQITEYKFTCDVKVNGEAVIEKAQPELKVDETQTSGLFVNSVTGDSNDADADIPGTVVKKTADNAAVGANNANAQSGDNNNAAVNNNADANNNVNANNNANNGAASSATSAPAATTSDGYFVTATDAEGKVTATSDEAPLTIAPADNTNGGSQGGSSPVLWIIIALVVLAGGGAAVYFFMKKKPAKVDVPETSEPKTKDE